MKVLLAGPNGEFIEENLSDVQVNGMYRGNFSELGRMMLCHDVETHPYIYNNEVMPLDFFVLYYSQRNDDGRKYNKGVSDFLPLDAGLCFGTAIILKLSKDKEGYCLAGLKRKEINFFKKEIKRKWQKAREGKEES